MGYPPSGLGFDFIMFALSAISLWLLLCLWMCIFFFFFLVGFSVLWLMVVQQLLVILVLSQEWMSTLSFSPLFWTRSIFLLFCSCDFHYCIFQISYVSLLYHLICYSYLSVYFSFHLLYSSVLNCSFIFSRFCQSSHCIHLLFSLMWLTFLLLLLWTL